MTLLEAIEARHSVRKYKDEPIPEEILTTLRERIRWPMAPSPESGTIS